MAERREDGHQEWLLDREYRRDFGFEVAKMEAARVLADARTLTGLTQAGLAERAGVTQAYIAKLERGDANPTVGQLGGLLAAMWMRVEMRPVPLDPASSLESVVLNVRGHEETRAFKVWHDVMSSTGDSSHRIEVTN